MVVIIGTSQFHILMLHLSLLESLDIRTISDCLEHIKVQGLQFKVYNLELVLIDSNRGIATILLVGFSFPHFSYNFSRLEHRNTN